ncbi:DUF397 domain-containing protein [Streptomyces sp. NPDC048550]|uniref:DUF397 domain-containing protein n=1 Tax=Streptomyces sp. NPDC048550 TaxID=3155739 RepID=UPI0034438D52
MTNHLTWFKSSYSDGDGSACIEVALDWRKSTHSDDQGSACVEVATCAHTIHVRDSKLGGDGPAFALPAGAWQAFLTQISG